MGYDRRADGLRTDGSKGHVLVVDDAAFAARHLTKTLTNAGYVVIAVAENGEDALKRYKQLAPDIDLVTLDITMPKLDGMSTLEKLLAFDPDAHVVMITSNGKRELAQRAIALGAKNFIEKPLQADMVLSRIEPATRT